MAPHEIIKLPTADIDYRKITKGELTDRWKIPSDKITVFDELVPNEGGYIDEVALKLFLEDEDTRLFTNSTTVLNFGVGQGKTRLTYALAGKYLKKGYKVIFASPYIKLVDKDYQELKGIYHEEGYKIIHYEELTQDDIKNNPEAFNNKVETADIFVATINFMLGNPGDDNVFQSSAKEKIKKIFRGLTFHKKPIVVFFDEFHDSYQNYHNDLIARLYWWEGYIEKIFITSATFNEAAIVALVYTSYLTNHKIDVLQSKRIKFPKQANLYYHFINSHSQGKGRFITLLPIKDIIEEARKNNPECPVHILTSYRKLAEDLTKSDSNDTLVKFLSNLNPTLHTNLEKDKPFSEEGTHIGTTFKTGVNLTKPNSLFIIIAPNFNKGDYTRMGIFTDGIPSIIQAIARLRQGGELHVFMPPPSFILDKEKIEDDRIKDLFSEIGNLKSIAQHEQYKPIEEDFIRLRDEITPLIEKYNSSTPPTALLRKPIIEEFILERSQPYLTKTNFELAKDFSSYTLWAGLNNQFSNATLRGINAEKVKRFVLPKDNVYIYIDYHLTTYYANEVAGFSPQTFVADYKKLVEIFKNNELLSYEFYVVLNDIISKLSPDSDFYEDKEAVIHAEYHKLSEEILKDKNHIAKKNSDRIEKLLLFYLIKRNTIRLEELDDYIDEVEANEYAGLSIPFNYNKIGDYYWLYSIYAYKNGIPLDKSLTHLYNSLDEFASIVGDTKLTYYNKDKIMAEFPDNFWRHAAEAFLGYITTNLFIKTRVFTQSSFLTEQVLIEFIKNETNAEKVKDSLYSFFKGLLELNAINSKNVFIRRADAYNSIIERLSELDEHNTTIESLDA